MKVSRRRFLLGGAAIAVIPAVIGGRALASSPESVLTRYIRSSVPGLAASDNDIGGFALQFIDNLGSRSQKLEAALFVMDNPWVERMLPSEDQRRYSWFTRSVMTDFLFSTDFFAEANMDPAKTNYIQYADPYSMGCMNPLAKFA